MALYAFMVQAPESELDGFRTLTANSETLLRAAEGDDLRQALIGSALALLAEGGRGDFSLRKVAERVGASGSAASHRFGDRAGLIAETCNAAFRQEAADLERFAQRLPPLDAQVDALAPVLVEWLDQRTRWSRTQARVSCELILMSYREPLVASYGAQLHGLYVEFLARLCADLPRAARDLLALFLIAESPNWLVLVDDSQFKLLSQETARRAVAMAIGADGAKPSFWVDFNTARNRAAPQAIIADGTKGRIAQSVAWIISQEGAHAVTHRAIAKAAGVSLSSLVHHFGKRGDLIRAGVRRLFQPPSEVEADALGATSVAAFELALYALSDPFLAPLMAEVRRRQGAREQSSSKPVGVQEVVELVACARELIDPQRRAPEALAGRSAAAS